MSSRYVSISYLDLVITLILKVNLVKQLKVFKAHFMKFFKFEINVKNQGEKKKKNHETEPKIIEHHSTPKCLVKWQSYILYVLNDFAYITLLYI